MRKNCYNRAASTRRNPEGESVHPFAKGRNFDEVISDDGFEIVRTTFRQPRPFASGMADIERALKASGLPVHALCGLELRSARPLSRQNEIGKKRVRVV